VKHNETKRFTCVETCFFYPCHEEVNHKTFGPREASPSLQGQLSLRQGDKGPRMLLGPLLSSSHPNFSHPLVSSPQFCLGRPPNLLSSLRRSYRYVQTEAVSSANTFQSGWLTHGPTWKKPTSATRHFGSQAQRLQQQLATIYNPGRPQASGPTRSNPPGPKPVQTARGQASPKPKVRPRQHSFPSQA
jgi:hypothetical protein